MNVVIIDYQAGNVTSVQRALASLGVESCITPDPNVVRAADRVIFPGVGAAASCMANLRSTGLDQALHDVVNAGTPVLGICVGMQLLFSHSDEDGGVECLNILPGTVKRFQPTDQQLKVPHMGWNPVTFSEGESLQTETVLTPYYFVHSFYCSPTDESLTVARSEHGIEFCAGVRRDNLVAMQFHPEKSGPAGLRLLQRFVEGT